MVFNIWKNNFIQKKWNKRMDQKKRPYKLYIVLLNIVLLIAPIGNEY